MSPSPAVSPVWGDVSCLTPAVGVSLATDPTDGHPVTLEIDWVLAAIDDEECYAVSEPVREDE